MQPPHLPHFSRTKRVLSALSAFSVLLVFLLACGKNAVSPTSNSTNISPTNSNASPFGSNKTSDLTANSEKTANNSTASTTKTSSATPEIAGNYQVSGANPDGIGTYEGDLTITKRDEVYQFSWKAGQDYDGVGVQIENTVAVAYTTGKDGKGCRVISYQTSSDGILNGIWGEWGLNQKGTEKATRQSGSGLDGEYETVGKNLDGKEYDGKLKIAADGSGYKFNWDNGDEGFGIKRGDFIVAGIGGKQCGFVAYEIGSDGTLNGKWGGTGVKEFGTETAKKQ